MNKNGIFLHLSSNLNLMPEQKQHQISKEKKENVEKSCKWIDTM